MGCFFWFTGRCAYNWGVEGGGAYNQKFTVCTPVYQYCIPVYTVYDTSPDKGLCDFVGADL